LEVSIPDTVLVPTGAEADALPCVASHIVAHRTPRLHLRDKRRLGISPAAAITSS